MDIDLDFCFQVRNVRTHVVMGQIDRWGRYLNIPREGEMATFIADYKALDNQDMGQVVEIYDPATDQLLEFAVIYEFGQYATLSEFETHIYYVGKFKLTNLDVLEIMYVVSEKERKVDTK